MHLFRFITSFKKTREFRYCGFPYNFNEQHTQNVQFFVILLVVIVSPLRSNEFNRA